jgi:hypothetical protein
MWRRMNREEGSTRNEEAKMEQARIEAKMEESGKNRSQSLANICRLLRVQIKLVTR